MVRKLLYFIFHPIRNQLIFVFGIGINFKVVRSLLLIMGSLTNFDVFPKVFGRIVEMKALWTKTSTIFVV